jgi:hypothetical protein
MYYMMYGELGKSPLENTVDKRMIHFWIKMSEGKASKLTCIVYKLLYKLYSAGEHKSVWLDTVKHILDCSGVSDIWSNQLNYDSKHLVKCLICRSLEDTWKQDWSLDIAL